MMIIIQEGGPRLHTILSTRSPRMVRITLASYRHPCLAFAQSQVTMLGIRGGLLAIRRSGVRCHSMLHLSHTNMPLYPALTGLIAMLPWLLLFVALFLAWKSQRDRGTMPGPRPFPVVGSVHLLGNHSSPFEAFTELSRKYGPIYSITLGSSPCVVVSSFPLIKDVLITKGGDFGGRPDFIRFHMLFGGDRNNSLALCDWSDLQKTRRSIARLYCSPRFLSTNYEVLTKTASEETDYFLTELSQHSLTDFELKPIIMTACANMFCNYMCSTRFSYADEGFRNMVRLFDEIFWEINQGYAVDFLPWLSPFYKKHMARLSCWSQDIRQFILKRIIDERWANLDSSKPPRDFTDALLLHLQNDDTLTWQHIIYELEDFLGGHSAIGNLIMLALGYIAKQPHVAREIARETQEATLGERCVSLADKPLMPYTEATILETLRISSSPIVPHVASRDTCLAGHKVSRGTVVFLNNYELNTSDKFWNEPEKFAPERFVEGGKITKPDFFIPFSTGKRTCIGQRLVQGFSFVLLAAIIQHYDIEGTPTEFKPACVALPPQTFRLSLKRKETIS